jgi:hypothetical protein
MMGRGCILVRLFLRSFLSSVESFEVINQPRKSLDAISLAQNVS